MEYRLKDKSLMKVFCFGGREWEVQWLLQTVPPKRCFTFVCTETLMCFPDSLEECVVPHIDAQHYHPGKIVFVFIQSIMDLGMWLRVYGAFPWLLIIFFFLIVRDKHDWVKFAKWAVRYWLMIIVIRLLTFPSMCSKVAHKSCSNFARFFW